MAFWSLLSYKQLPLTISAYYIDKKKKTCIRTALALNDLYIRSNKAKKAMCAQREAGHVVVPGVFVKINLGASGPILTNENC